MRLDPFVIRKAVRESGLKQNDIAEAIGAKKGNVSAVLNKRATSRPLLEKLRDFLATLPKK